MSGLRTAGSQAYECPRLTRDQQNNLLLAVVMETRLASRQHRCPSCGSRVVLMETHQEMTEGVRKALRLDDPVLEDLIASGAYKRPWSSEVPSC
jgi:DNA-directed RNA polymerase subunit RPC12/RpoP